MGEELQKIPEHNVPHNQIQDPNSLTAIPSDPYYSFSTGEWLKERFNEIYRYKAVVVISFLLILLFTILFTFTQKPVYRGVATIKINFNKSEVLPYKTVGEDQAGLFDFENFFKTQVEILKSRSLAQRVVERLDLDEHPDWLGLKKESFRKHSINPSEGIEPTSEINLYAEYLLKNLQVTPVRNTRLVQIKFDSVNAQAAAQIANAYAEAFIAFGLDRKLEANQHARHFLAQQLDSMRKKLALAEEKLATFTEQTGIVKFPGVDRSPAEQELNRVSEAVSKARFEMIRREVYLEKAKAAMDAGKLAAIPDSPFTVDLKKILLKEQAKYRELEDIYKEEYPKMSRLRTEIEGLNKEISEEKEATIEKLEADYEAAKRHYESLEEEWKEAMVKVKKEGRLLSQYALLKREADTDREMYTGLLKRLKETDITSALNSGNIEVIETSPIPKVPVKPQKIRNILFALVFGSLTSCGLALGLAKLDTRIRSKEEIEKQLGIPVLGSIPDIELIKGEGIDEIPKDIPFALTTYSSPESFVSNAFRQIRTLLHYAIPNRKPQLIAITSTYPSEGKSSTIVNLATVLGQQGTVLIIDGDLRKPSLHKSLGLRPRPGLSEILTGQVNIEEALQLSTIPNVWAISGGRAAIHPTDLLGSESMHSLIQLVRQYFCYILIDTPPMHGMPDAAIIGSVTDGLIYVIQAGRIERKDFLQNLQILATVNARILGVVLNKTTTSYQSYYSYYAYKEKNEIQNKNQTQSLSPFHSLQFLNDWVQEKIKRPDK
ncbi:capsular biosynthesis protein [Candidatus Methylacidiphilum fumarolicum]|uniref:Capsular polysaccharide synthesis enzyme cpsD fused to Mrp family ATPase n=2 Tax=Candidatus Methylacidiphilum fumarolicum TaxID=591154 RepID=I0JYY7_METFB|nr:polysaccharide biosynthesis tyrosine autokinase [Candidatus Methylacidiphilum fumarolicum]TFE65643.1 capsular biosynthesis protein [Candidatus Methylacidiphilum fumarolicum]TFE74196.1 capsular biosynthesis protein [Candidatus Methylacidiphilum fumarolicum]TFE75695.1 capsular biosynthesis protein [Candidatus Methylacidiphilum fumarolicum]TFE75855.1 capsular biosynthesis protein [Candidatus Methylacidiphilum fumarolicum]CAI9084841.1 Capsular polysaccharide synthesis enzyme cpsD fused to Mrp f